MTASNNPTPEFREWVRQRFDEHNAWNKLSPPDPQNCGFWLVGLEEGAISGESGEAALKRMAESIKQVGKHAHEPDDNQYRDAVKWAFTEWKYQKRFLNLVFPHAYDLTHLGGDELLQGLLERRPLLCNLYPLPMKETGDSEHWDNSGMRDLSGLPSVSAYKEWYVHNYVARFGELAQELKPKFIFCNGKDAWWYFEQAFGVQDATKGVRVGGKEFRTAALEGGTLLVLSNHLSWPPHAPKPYLQAIGEHIAEHA